jgi:hypothetical protein
VQGKNTNCRWRLAALLATLVFASGLAARAADNSAVKTKPPKHQKIPELSKETAPDIHQGKSAGSAKPKIKHKKKEKPFDVDQKPGELNPKLNK